MNDPFFLLGVLLLPILSLKVLVPADVVLSKDIMQLAKEAAELSALAYEEDPRRGIETCGIESLRDNFWTTSNNRCTLQYDY
jgi:hypothetical protein